LPCRTFASAETFHFTVRIDRGAATRPCGTTYLAAIILRAIPHATFDGAKFIPDRAASFLGTEHLPVLIRRALSFPANYISNLILDAIRGIDLTDGSQRQKTTN